MDATAFKDYLLKDHTEDSTNTRMSDLNKVAGILGENIGSLLLDIAVYSDAIMHDTLLLLKSHDGEKAPLQNVLRHYYKFKNGKEFPRL